MAWDMFVTSSFCDQRSSALTTRRQTAATIVSTTVPMTYLFFRDLLLARRRTRGAVALLAIVMTLLFGRTVVVSTHDDRVAQALDHVVDLDKN